MKLILIMTYVAGFLYSRASCDTGGVTPHHQVGHGTQQK